MARRLNLDFADPRVRLIMGALLIAEASTEQRARFATDLMHVGDYPFVAYFGIDPYTRAAHVASVACALARRGLLLRVYQERAPSQAQAYHSKKYRIDPVVRAPEEEPKPRRSPRFYLSEAGVIQTCSALGIHVPVLQRPMATPWWKIPRTRGYTVEGRIDDSLEVARYTGVDQELAELHLTAERMYEWATSVTYNSNRQMPPELKTAAYRISHERRKFVA